MKYSAIALCLSAIAAQAAVIPRHLKRQGDPQTSLTLDPSVICTGCADDGQNPPVAGQAAALTSVNNYINFCLGKELTNGQQKAGGSCNGVPMGDIIPANNMPASRIVFPVNGGTINANEAFTFRMLTRNMALGNFVNAQQNYFGAPQQLQGGILLAHSHVTIQLINAINSEEIPPATEFAFFKGLNEPPNGQGELTTDVTAGLPPGVYRVCSMNTAANHQPAVVAVAQHGPLDDCIYTTAVVPGQNNGQNNNGQDNGQNNGQDAGQNNGQNNNGQDAGQNNGQNNGQDNGQNNGQDAGQNNGQDAGQNNGQDAGQNNGQDAGQGQNAGQDAGQNNGQDAGQNNGQDAGQNAGQDAGQNNDQDAGQNNGQDAGQDNGQDAGQNNGQDAGQNAGQDAGQNNGQDAGQNNGQDAAQGAGQDAGQNNGQDAGQNNGQDAGQNNGQDAAQGAGQDAGGQNNGQNAGQNNGQQQGNNQNGQGQVFGGRGRFGRGRFRGGRRQ